MKKTLLMLTLLIAPLAVCAQQFAHFTSTDVLQAMPDYRKAYDEMNALRAQYSSELQTMQQEFQTKYEKFQKEVNEQTPAAIRERRVAEMEQLQDRLEQTQRDFSSQLEQQEAQKLEPIMKKVQDAINTVARAGNFVYVMDKNTALRNNVFVNEALSVDVTSRIMDALSITPEDIAAGKAFVARMQQEAQQQQQQSASQPAGTR